MTEEQWRNGATQLITDYTMHRTKLTVIGAAFDAPIRVLDDGAWVQAWVWVPIEKAKEQS